MQAMKVAKVHPSQVDAVNCHARSTVSGDNSEAHCLHSLFAYGNHQKTFEEFSRTLPEEVVTYYEKPLPSELPILFGQKGHIGHAVAGAAAIETVFSLLSIKHQIIPMIKNLKTPCEPKLSFALDGVNTPRKVDVVVKNGFVFGGLNCSIVMKKY